MPSSWWFRGNNTPISWRSVHCNLGWSRNSNARSNCWGKVYHEMNKKSDVAEFTLNHITIACICFYDLPNIFIRCTWTRKMTRKGSMMFRWSNQSAHPIKTGMNGERDWPTLQNLEGNRQETFRLEEKPWTLKHKTCFSLKLITPDIDLCCILTCSTDIWFKDESYKVAYEPQSNFD